jgi:hypothetical protein
MSAALYFVQTRDVDGSTLRKFRTLDGAVKRFESMSGLKVADAIAEQFYAREQAGQALPAIEDVQRLRAVSMFGTVVSFEKREAVS